MIDDISREALRLEESLTWTFKQHHEAEVIWNRRHWWLGIPASALGIGAGAAALRELPTSAVAAGILVSAGLGGALTLLHPGKRAQDHREAGRVHQDLYERCRRWRTIDLSTRSAEQARQELEEIAEQKAALAAAAPSLPRAAYRRVRRGMAAGEAVFDWQTPRTGEGP